MQTKRLLKMAKFMEELPREVWDRFNMGMWAYRERGENLPTERHRIDVVDCGTAGCLLGWTPSCFPRSGIVLEFPRDNRTGEVVYTRSSGRQSSGIAAGEGFFGLTLRQAIFLFLPSSYPEMMSRITPKDAATQIRRLVANPTIANGTRGGIDED